jgi:hypothetical protein
MTIRRLAYSDKAIFSQLDDLIGETHSDCLPPYYPVLLKNSESGYLLYASIDSAPIGFSQVFLANWKDAFLIAYLDLLGVKTGFRCKGIATNLIRRAIETSVMIAQSKATKFAGLVSMTEIDNVASKKAFSNAGAEIRTDLEYSIPDSTQSDHVIWISHELNFVPTTRELAYFLWQFGNLDSHLFVNKYGIVNVPSIKRYVCS